MATASAMHGAPLAVPPLVGSVHLDGDLSDAAWQSAARIDHWVESSPGDNVAPKVQTVALLGHDERYLYVAIRASDPQPSRIQAPYGDRDDVLSADDSVTLFLDTRNDRRSAIELRVNARGVQADGIYNDANGNEDLSADFFFDAACRITAEGWTAELRIPFSSLRYGEGETQIWGLLIRRNYPREFRYSLTTAPISRQALCLICNAQPIALSGLRSAAHLTAAPYLAGRSDRASSAPFGPPARTAGAEVGGDVKWLPSADHTVDVALNPDFSQVESDVAELTANQRFAVFYQEKRPFFLEGLDLFDTPIQAVHTRTITSPRWGLRATGKIGASSYTVLATDDRGGGLVILPGPTSSGFALQDFTSRVLVARVRHDLANSFAGVLLTDREVRGGGHNRVCGPDFQWRRTDHDSLTGQLLVSDTTASASLPTSGQRSWAGLVTWMGQSARYDAEARIASVGSAFRADTGFVPQTGYRELELNFARRLFPTRGPLSYLRTYFWGNAQTDQRGGTVFRKQDVGAYLEGRRGLVAGIELHPAETYRVGDVLARETYLGVGVELNPSRLFPYLAVRVRGGDSIDFATGQVGRGWKAIVDLKSRPSDRITLDLHAGRESLDVRQSRVLVADVLRLKAAVSVSDRGRIRAIAQSTSTRRDDLGDPTRERSFAGSLLYSYRVNWQTALFVGYGDSRVTDEADRLYPRKRSFFFKVSYALQR